ncbi:MAG TPA: CarD family transcriptional regulator, partial [Bacteroidia bacterium]|nr:CarD family transcriptional regulator [Bacteroidia bacterium]
MAIDSVLQQYLSSDKTLQLTQKLNSDTVCHAYLQGLIGSSASFVASAISKSIPQTHLFILNEKEEAAYFLNDLENITGGKKIFFLPASYRKAYDPELTDNANISLRAEVLNAISAKSNTLIVTYPEALNEKVVTKTHLKKNTLALQVGEKISIDFITQVLVTYHFNRVDYVAEPGEFSVRGGIVDIFSFANENPYRVEFSGDNVDSIRTFDAATQLSVQTVSYCSIIPNLQINIDKENRQTFFEFIPENTIVWLKDTVFTVDRIQDALDVANKIYEQKKSLIEQLPPEEIYCSKELFLEQLSQFKTIEFGGKPYFNSDMEMQYNIAPQFPFNKNFNLLLDHLKSNIAKGITNFIFSDNQKQLERLHKIFEDVSGTNTLFFQEGNSGTLYEGFADNDLKIACYTDHQIFNRHARFRLKSGFKKTSEAITLKELKGLHPGDFVTHIDHGVGRFAGLEKMDVNGKQQEVIRIMYKDNDLLYVSIHSLHRIAKYSGKEGAEPKINKLGSNSWSVLKQKTKKKVKEIAFDLIQLYAKRKAQKGN